MKNSRKRFLISSISAVLACSILSVTAVAVTTGKGKCQLKGNFTDTVQSQDYDYNANLIIGYYYGSTSAKKADMIGTYGYGTENGNKHVKIKYGDKSKTSESFTNTTVAQLSITEVAEGSVEYSGYTKVGTLIAEIAGRLDYTLTLTDD